MIFLRFNPKLTIKFLTKSTYEEQEIMIEKVFKGNSMNKINLERMTKNKIEFQK